MVLRGAEEFDDADIQLAGDRAGPGDDTGGGARGRHGRRQLAVAPRDDRRLEGRRLEEGRRPLRGRGVLRIDDDRSGGRTPAIYDRISALGKGAPGGVVLDVAHIGVIDGLVFIERTDASSTTATPDRRRSWASWISETARSGSGASTMIRASLLREMGVSPGVDPGARK
jgi:hypothetical protein